MEKTKSRFIIIGSGWRAMYYARIAAALPESFELCAMLCRSQEKADAVHVAQGIYTTTSIEECRRMKPDFVVVAVSKASIAEVTLEWASYGFPVLCETPAALDEENLCGLWEAHLKGAVILSAEQYTRYPLYQAMVKVLDSNLIGAPDGAVVSLAHGYHGASLIRAFLREGMTAFRVSGREFTFPTTETLSRYERFTDGRVGMKKRTTAVIEFQDGKVALFDFDSEQYRSPIRHNYVNIRGCRGEMKDEVFYYLDQENQPVEASLEANSRRVRTASENPNLREFAEVTGITFQGKSVYTPPFGRCGLSEDETAIALVMADVAACGAGKKEADYPLREALQDCYMAILLEKSVKEGWPVESKKMPWQE
ncbi:MAG: Gfo/Idh/MocA family oxidoreductase [Lachnospiraceae bacterium]|nr:Gfo/Idh/MocA family oxidoreductase [Lachnospiraceae bacterium]